MILFLSLSFLQLLSVKNILIIFFKYKIYLLAIKLFLIIDRIYKNVSQWIEAIVK